jgi:hypothetical protein
MKYGVIVRYKGNGMFSVKMDDIEYELNEYEMSDMKEDVDQAWYRHIHGEVPKHGWIEENK